MMFASVTVTIGLYLVVYLLTRNLWISIVAGIICGLIWKFMSGDD